MFRLHQEEIVDQEELNEVLLEARQSLWVHIPMLMIMVLSVVILFFNCLGCAGACILSYSLLSGKLPFFYCVSASSSASSVLQSF